MRKSFTRLFSIFVLLLGLSFQMVYGTVFVPASSVPTDGNINAISRSVWTFRTGLNFVTDVVDPLENGNGSLFKVYPNPFDTYVDVVSSSKLSKVVVTNIAGQVVKEVVNPAQRIQLNELRSGIYFISLYDMDNVIAKTAKIVKR